MPNVVLHKTETRLLRQIYTDLSIVFNAEIYFVSWVKEDYYTLTYNRKLIKDISFHKSDVIDLLMHGTDLIFTLRKQIREYVWSTEPNQTNQPF